MQSLTWMTFTVGSRQSRETWTSMPLSSFVCLSIVWCSWGDWYGSGNLCSTFRKWRWLPVCQHGAVSSCVTFSPLPSAFGSLRSERDPCALPVSRWVCLWLLLSRCLCSCPALWGRACRCPCTVSCGCPVGLFPVTSSQQKRSLGMCLS